MKVLALVTADTGFAGVVIGAAGFENVITTGQLLLGLVLGVATLVGVFYGVRYKVSNEANAALARARGEALDDSKEREGELQSALSASKEANAQLRTSVEKLEALPNLARILETMSENVARQEEARTRQFTEMDKHSAARTADAVKGVLDHLDARLTHHEERAQERHEAVMRSSEATGERIVTALTAVEAKINGGSQHVDT